MLVYINILRGINYLNFTKINLKNTLGQNHNYDENKKYSLIYAIGISY